MISKDLVVTDPGPDNWSRLYRFAVELALSVSPGTRAATPGTLLVVYRGLRVLKAIDLSARRVIEVEWPGTSRLGLLARGTGYERVLALEETALARVFEHAQREMKFSDDLLEQLACFARGVALEWRRTIFTYPPGPAGIPVIPTTAIRGAVRSVIGDDTLLLLALTDKGRLWASVVLGYRDGEFRLVSSLDAVGLDGWNIREGGVHAAVELLETKYGGKVRAVFMERGELARITASRFPPGEALLALNGGDLSFVRAPLRWKALLFSAALLMWNRRAKRATGTNGARTREANVGGLDVSQASSTHRARVPRPLKAWALARLTKQT